MDKCSESCPAVCDFCSNYYFNADDGGVYVNNGFCKLLRVKKDPEQECEDFRCFLKNEITRGETK
jgi:hypothetical protein